MIVIRLLFLVPITFIMLTNSGYHIYTEKERLKGIYFLKMNQLYYFMEVSFNYIFLTKNHIPIINI